MRFREIKFIGIVVMSLFVAACSDSPNEKAPEPVDIQATEQINDKLLDSMRQISSEQLDYVEDAGKDALETLSEADRQSLIDLTIDNSAKAVQQDADKMVELLEDINGISDEEVIRGQ